MCLISLRTTDIIVIRKRMLQFLASSNSSLIFPRAIRTIYRCAERQQVLSKMRGLFAFRGKITAYVKGGKERRATKEKQRAESRTAERNSHGRLRMTFPSFVFQLSSQNELRSRRGRLIKRWKRASFGFKSSTVALIEIIV